MATIVLGIGTSHTPMLNAPVEDWPGFIELDAVRPHLDKDGRRATYQELLRNADPGITAQLTPRRMADRHAAAQAALLHVADVLAQARLETLIIVGDDQK